MIEPVLRMKKVDMLLLTDRIILGDYEGSLIAIIELKDERSFEASCNGGFLREEYNRTKRLNRYNEQKSCIILERKGPYEWIDGNNMAMSQVRVGELYSNLADIADSGNITAISEIRKARILKRIAKKQQYKNPKIAIN